MADIDSAILDALGCSADDVSFSSLGSSFSTTGKLTFSNGTSYFLKSSPSKVMILGESASLRTISSACPGFCPSVVACGETSSRSWFLITTFLNTHSETSLAQNLATLHAQTSPAGMFGFDVATCCADTVQDNTWTSDWCHFFIERRLRPISQLSSNADDDDLQGLVERACSVTVPRLLSSDHLKIKPALIHGDLWSGNAQHGQVFDACACYAHSEFELSIMHMFGGFTRDLEEYERLKKRDEPVNEFEDRLALYMCYHQLNHSGTGQGSHYKASAKQTLKRLIDVYGNS